MRVAVLIQGEPRFCREFDLFLERLKGYDQADFYFYLWKKSQPISDYWRTRESVLVAEPWTDIDSDWAENKIRSNLPANCNLIKLELVDQNTLTFPEIKENYDGINKNNVWKMLYSLHKVNELKTEQEIRNNFMYDLVIRARPDLMLHNNVDLNNIKQRIDENNNLVALPDNTRCGTPTPISDLMAISSSKNMDIYCNLYEEALDYYTSGLVFHPESLLACHLLTYNLDFSQNFGYSIDIRYFGQRTGNEKYISDFGRWDL
jgi:hypothetical protein